MCGVKQSLNLLSSCIRARFWTSPRSFKRCDMEESEVLDSRSSKSISWEELLESFPFPVFIPPWLLPFPLPPPPLLPFPVWTSRITSNVVLLEVWRWWLSPPPGCVSRLFGGDFWYVEFRPRPPLVNVELRPWLCRKPEKNQFNQGF